MNLTAEGDVPYGRLFCKSHNATDPFRSRHEGTLQGDILDERVIDVCEHPTRKLPGRIVQWVNGKPRDRVPSAVKSSPKGRARIANRLKAPIPVLCLACRDVLREHISAIQLRIHILEIVDVMYAHIVIVPMRRATEVLDNPCARCCRCGMMRDIRARIVGDLLRGR